MRGLSYVLVPWVLGGAALFECNSSNPCDDAGACVDASTIPTVSGGGCDSSKPASQGGCAVDDSDGFFVSPTGSDSAAGSKAAPFKTIGKGITAAATASKKPNVYVCAGTYPENLVIQNAPEGVALHGGFDCASWAQTNAVTTVSPAWVPNATAPQYVLHVAGAAALVEGLTMTAPNATDPGASSVGAFITDSPGMTFRRATVTGGTASNGADGQQAAQLPASSTGNSTTDGTAPPAKVCNCSTDKTTGGAGGGFADGGFSPPGPGLPVISGNTDAGQAGTPYAMPSGGADGLEGKTGNSTATLGELTVNGWTASPGASGVTGGTAQGGGGSYGDPGATKSGGSGGCGGCGGQGGTGGSGGGASIAVAAVNVQKLRIQTSTIRAGKAGNGGNGGLGQLGQPGGVGGGTQPLAGGIGGRGGNGGAGGGGAGGVSVAIAFAPANATPDVDTQSTVLAGTPGSGGHDGTAVQAKAIDGVADAVHAF